MLCFGGHLNGLQLYADPVLSPCFRVRRPINPLNPSRRQEKIPPELIEDMANAIDTYWVRRGHIAGERIRPFWVLEGTEIEDYPDLAQWAYDNTA